MANFKQKGVWFLPLAILMILIGTSAAVFARTAPGTILPAAPKLMSQVELNGNAWQIYTTNYGPFANPGAGSGGFWPRGSGRGYIYGAGLWVGATDAAGNKIVACGYDPNSAQHEMGPVSMDNSYAGYLSDSKARVYLSTNPVDVADWPVKDEAELNVIKSRQDSYAKYSDQNPVFTFSGEKQLGVLVEQISYAWNYADNNDIVFFYFKVINISGKSWTNVYMGPGTDCDIGDEGVDPNDRTAFDYTRNLAIQFQQEDESDWPETGVVGFRYFESPVNNTGASIHVVDNEFTHDVLPDSALGMTAFKVFTLSSDPPSDEERYLEMTGVNWWDMNNDAYDEWGALTADDKRFMMASGPFNLAAGETTSTCIGAICALDTVALKNASDIAQTIYDNDFELATPPAAPTLTLTPGDKFIHLSWDKKAETTPDPYWAKLPAAKDWYTYFPGSWEFTLPATKLLVDSFEIKTGAATTDTIARGAANPIGGTDTARAFYSQQELYDQYDFQGYLVYRARTQADLAYPAKREFVGTLATDLDTAYNASTLSFGGGQGYFYDKIDGIKIVIDLDPLQAIYPGGVDTFPKYDTLGTDRGLIYTLVDNNVINGVGYWYGVSAYDYQRNVYFTHKCPTTLITNPTENSGYVVSRTPTADLVPAAVNYAVTGISSAKNGGTVDYQYQLSVVPSQINKDTFRLKWLPITKVVDGIDFYPEYKAELHDMQINDSGLVIDTILTTVKILPKYSFLSGDNYASFNGTFDDQLPFGGVIFNPYYCLKPWTAEMESMEITENDAIIYPLDSIWVQAGGNSNFTLQNGCWQWRGSDFEIRWKDTIVSTRNCLTATVWDITHNLQVPLEYNKTKKAMTQSSWCFNPTANACNNFADSSALSALGMYICGATVYFNRRDGGTQKRMIWPLRPHTGDVWTLRSKGLGVPMEGEEVTFITTEALQVSNPSTNLLDAVKVVPNPYLVRANWDVSKNYPNIYFTRLPAKCTIRIFTLAGDLIRVINHDSAYDENNGTEQWDLLTTYDKRPASGVYIYQIDAPGIGTKLGKFAIIK